MAGIFKRIFSKKEPEESLKIRVADLSVWLENERNGANSRMEEVTTESRTTALAEIGNLEKAIVTLKEIKVDAKEVPPKLQRVVHHSIPKYVAAMEKLLTREFREDADGYYQDLADFVQTSGKTMQTKGRYITALLPDEMKAIRESVAVYGREINKLNETFREAKEHLEELDRVEKKLDTLLDLLNAEDQRAEEKEALTAELETLLTGIPVLEEQEQRARNSSDYRQAERLLKEEIHINEEIKDTEEQFARLLANTANAFRKAEYAARQKDVPTADAVKALIGTLGKPLPDAAREAAQKYQALYPDLLPLFEEGNILKNQTEQELFANADRVFEELEEIAVHIKKVRHAAEETRQELAALDILQEIRTTEERKTASKARVKSIKALLADLGVAHEGFDEEYATARESLITILEEASGREVELQAENP